MPLPAERVGSHALRLDTTPVDRDEDRNGVAGRSRRPSVGGNLAPQSGKAAVADLQRRFIKALFPALAKLDDFASHATPAERARMFEPVA